MPKIKNDNRKRIFTEKQFRTYVNTGRGFDMMWSAMDIMFMYNKDADYIRKEIIKVEDWEQLAAFNYMMKNKVSVGGYTPI